MHRWSLEEINQDLLLEAREDLFNEQRNQQTVAAIKVSFLWCKSLRGRLLCASAKLEAKFSEMKSTCFKNVLAQQAEIFNENNVRNSALSWRGSAMVTKQQRGLLPLRQELQDGPALLKQPATLILHLLHPTLQ
jgi:hypothetical protein